ncbi:ribonuclease E/G [Sporolactobacillus vineae]|uniref:ribonuclease E/G n=1 Tax=Sporolactobacillus vineae TaxID=444463 RepID=UPI0002898116|nr:ribonuclease E/G [Sporolactobacillus vineae]
MQDQGPVIVVDGKGNSTRAAYLEDGEVKSFYLSAGVHRIGDIYKARIGSDRMRGIGWFLKLGDHETGFLPKSERLSENVPASGNDCLVQIQKEARAGKPAQVTRQIQIVGRGLIYLPNGGYTAVSRRIDAGTRETLRRLASDWCTGAEGVIIRTSAVKMTAARLERELKTCRDQWKKIQECALRAAGPGRLWRQFSFIESILNENHFPCGCTVYSNIPVDGPPLPADVRFICRPGEALFSSWNLDAAFKEAQGARVPVRGGGYLNIEHMETLTAIDVNSGSAASGSDWEKTALKINREAAGEIARQIRLRGTGGMIVIDFIRLKNLEDRETILDALKAAFAEDPSAIRLYGFSPMGLVELTRKRQRTGLNRLSAGYRSGY